MRDAVSLIFNFINRKQQCAIFFLSTEQEDNTHTIGRGPILFDISFADRSERDSKSNCVIYQLG